MRALVRIFSLLLLILPLCTFASEQVLLDTLKPSYTDQEQDRHRQSSVRASWVHNYQRLRCQGCCILYCCASIFVAPFVYYCGIKQQC